MRFSGNALTLRGARGDRTRSWPWRSQLGPSSTGSHESGDSGVICTSDSAMLFLLSSHPYAGPKLFKEPSAKSNKHIIQNALAHCCLAGKVNEGQKKKILEVRVCGVGGRGGRLHTLPAWALPRRGSRVPAACDRSGTAFRLLRFSSLPNAVLDSGENKKL